jgi:hypothetical protein
MHVEIISKENILHYFNAPKTAMSDLFLLEETINNTYHGLANQVCSVAPANSNILAFGGTESPRECLSANFPLHVPSKLRRNSTSSMGRVCANLGAHPHFSLLCSLTQHTT